MSLVYSGRRQRALSLARCPQPLKNAQRPVGSSSPGWDGASKRSEETDCTRRRLKRQQTQQALVPLCGLSEMALLQMNEELGGLLKPRYH